MEREHPYEAYTSCQLVSSYIVMSSTTTEFTALATSFGLPRAYKAQDRGEVGESETPGGPKLLPGRLNVS